MKIGFLTIGTEILLGDTVNTNLTNLGKRLNENGFKLEKELTIPDRKEEIDQALKFLLQDCDVVITSGGLGPTEDDITKETISESLSLKLELDEDHLEWMKERWKARGLIMPEKDNTDYQFVMFFNQAESSLAAEIDKFKPEGLDIAYLAGKGIIKLRFDKNSVSNEQADMFLQNISEKFEDDILSYLVVAKKGSKKFVKNNILKIEGIKDVDLKLVWDPPWSKEKMSETAKLELNL